MSNEERVAKVLNILGAARHKKSTNNYRGSVRGGRAVVVNELRGNLTIINFDCSAFTPSKMEKLLARVLSRRNAQDD